MEAAKRRDTVTADYNTEKMTRRRQRVKRSLPIKKSDDVEKTLKIQRALNNAAWSKATRLLLDGGKGENSVNTKLQWESRRRTSGYVSKVECAGITRVWLQARLETVWIVRGAKKIEKSSNKCLRDAVLTASAEMKAPPLLDPNTLVTSVDKG